MKKKTIICFIVFAVIVLGACIIILYFYRSKPILATPYTIEPFANYGICIEDTGLFARYDGLNIPNRVYLLGAFMGGDVISGQEITHKINVKELVGLIADTNMRRRMPRQKTPIVNYWSIYLRQNNRTMHIMLGERSMAAVSGSNIRFFNINCDAINKALERMVLAYTKYER